MLRDLSSFLSPVLALLLMVLTPLGTGSGAYRDQLLDPLFPHVHVAGPLAPGLVRFHALMTSRLFFVPTAVALALAFPAATALAHAYPKTMEPSTNARLDGTPAHIGITFDSPITRQGSSLVLLDTTGATIPTTDDTVDGNTRASISPTSELQAGPYTVAWTSVSAEDGHSAQGFYTFVVNGGPVGVLTGTAQSQAPAADLMATLTVEPADDGSSMLRVDLNNTSAVERVRIRLSRPDLGDDLLDTKPSGDGGWVLNGNEVALPGAWHAQVIVRRTNIFDDAQGGFDFNVDPISGTPSFGAANSIGIGLESALKDAMGDGGR